ncbi:MAG: hypothetical protein KAT53_06105, partial [Dehalococcoidia bacterium]|nr:hypothetical protein [Dehalococcoidia bacterium]
AVDSSQGEDPDPEIVPAGRRFQNLHEDVAHAADSNLPPGPLSSKRAFRDALAWDAIAGPQSLDWLWPRR